MGKVFQSIGGFLQKVKNIVKKDRECPVPLLEHKPTMSAVSMAISNRHSSIVKTDEIKSEGSKIIVQPRLQDDEYLYVILPYFNYCGFQRRKELFLEFVDRIKNLPKVRVVISEAREATSEYDLPCNNSRVYIHVRTVTNHRFWIKENLINLAVKKLPSTWKYMAWVDADISFMNTKWVEDTISALNTYDVIQLYQCCLNLGPNGEGMKLDQSFGYMYCESGRPYHKTAKYGFWHPGYAWGCNRKAYDQMTGLVDWGILGSGDRHMALALIGLVEYSYPGNIHKTYATLLKEYQERCKGLRLGYVPGIIMHYWHGRLADRKYQERWNILTKNQYDPDVDIYFTEHGVIQLSSKGERLQPELSAYFAGRNEDNKQI